MSGEASEFPIDEILRHRPPMRFIDEVMHADERGIRARFTPRAGVLFAAFDDAISTLVLYECMAQAACCHAGWMDWRVGRAPGYGLLLGSRSFRVHVASLQEGRTLEILARPEIDAAEMLGMYDAEVRFASNDETSEVIAAARIKAAYVRTREEIPR